MSRLKIFSIVFIALVLVNIFYYAYPLEESIILAIVGVIALVLIYFLGFIFLKIISNSFVQQIILGLLVVGIVLLFLLGQKKTD